MFTFSLGLRISSSSCSYYLQAVTHWHKFVTIKIKKISGQLNSSSDLFEKTVGIFPKQPQCLHRNGNKVVG